jgi:hypothetical protein
MSAIIQKISSLTFNKRQRIHVKNCPITFICQASDKQCKYGISSKSLSKNAVKIICLLFVCALLNKAYSQCTNVCIQGVPTFSCSNCGGGGGTSTVSVNNFPAVQQISGTVTTTGGGGSSTPVDSITLGVTNGNNLSSNAKEVTANQILGALKTVTPSNYTTTTTYTYITTSGSNTIPAGMLSISVSNVGSSNASFNGSTLPPGATINIQIPNAILPSQTYDCLTSALMILYNQ